MPEIRELYQNTSNFNDNEWSSDWVFVGDISQVIFDVYCSQNCTFGIRWAIDDQFVTDFEDIKTLLATETLSMTVPIRTRYAQFYVNTFGSLPCTLRTQGLFSTSFTYDVNGSASDVSLISSGATGAVSLISSSLGPILGVKGLTGGTGINLVSTSTEIIISGLNSVTGPTGAQGTNGSQGETGAQGPTGQQGSNGLQGATGATGVPGTATNTGATGETGIQGPTGATGSQGSTGATGSPGSASNTGSTGATGPIGIQGNQGYSGFVTIGSYGIMNASYVPTSTYAISCTGASQLISPTGSSHTGLNFVKQSDGVMQYYGYTGQTGQVYVKSDMDIFPTDPTYYYTFELRKNGLTGTVLASRSTFTQNSYEHININAVTNVNNDDTLAVYCKNNAGLTGTTTNLIYYNLTAQALIIGSQIINTVGSYRLQSAGHLTNPSVILFSATLSTHPNVSLNLSNNIFTFNANATYTFNLGVVWDGSATARYIQIVVNGTPGAIDIDTQFIYPRAISFPVTLSAGSQVFFYAWAQNPVGNQIMSSTAWSIVS